MNAMGNSSKNASEVIDRLQLRINRTRQARITTELCEIIGGMEGLKAKE
jgi:ATP synthase F1 gamma subunit